MDHPRVVAPRARIGRNNTLSRHRYAARDPPGTTEHSLAALVATITVEGSLQVIKAIGKKKTFGDGGKMRLRTPRFPAIPEPPRRELSNEVQHLGSVARS